LVVRVWGVQYREELILNFTVFVVRDWGEQYNEELVLNDTVICEGLGRAIKRGTDSERYCACCEGLGRAI